LATLDCRSAALTSLTLGTNNVLSDLKCFSNSLSTLNITGNAGLTNLDCHVNSLTGLNTTNNTLLTQLDISDNQISSVNLATNTALSKLYASNNMLTSVNIATNMALTEIFAESNVISGFDASSHTALTTIQMQHNSFTTFNVTGCTALTTIGIGYNLLNSLNVSGNAALTSLYCYNNQLTALNLSANTALTQLSCGQNTISTLDLSANTALVWLFAASNGLTSLNIQNGNNVNMTQFYVPGNPNCCIKVDNVAFANTNWSVNKDASSTFSTVCPLPCFVTIPDVAFKAFLVGNASINTNSDTEIQCSEAIAYSGNIGLFVPEVASLTGIEAFVNLTSLSCAFTLITTLDLTSNIALTYVNVPHNLLTSINVNGLTALQYLYCPQNLLTSINVSTNTALLQIQCFNNQLTSLNVSANHLLDNVWCQDNLLTSLNVQQGNNAGFVGGGFNATNNPSLTCIQVDNVAYSNTNWATNKDASANYSTNCNCSAPAAAQATGTNNFCASGNTTFTASATGTDANTTYTWSGPSGYAGASTAAASNLTISGTYTCIISNGTGCTASVSRTLTITPTPTPQITGNTTICTGGSTTLTANGGSQFSWSNGATTASITVSPATSTSYMVFVATNGCSAPTSQLVTVNACNPTVQGGFPANQCGYLSNIPNGAINCNTVTGASSYTFKVYTVGGSTILFTSTRTVNTFKLPNISGQPTPLNWATQYDVTVTPNGSSITGTESAKCRFGIIVQPTAANIAPTQLKSPVCQSVAALAPTLASTAVITCTTVTQAGAYEFKFVNVANASNTVTALASYVNQRTLAPLGLTAGATYAVSARAKVGGVWAANFGQNCFIKISQPAPSVPQGGRLGVQSTSVSTTSPWGGLEGLSVSVFPNPFSSEFTLNVSSAKVEVVSVVINDVTGKTVYSQKANTNTLITINDAQLQSGIYFVNVRSIDGSTIVRKVVKTN